MNNFEIAQIISLRINNVLDAVDADCVRPIERGLQFNCDSGVANRVKIVLTDDDVYDIVLLNADDNNVVEVKAVHGIDIDCLVAELESLGICRG